MEVQQDKKSCTHKELESFVGHLVHAARVICLGRIFLRSLFLLLSTTAKPHFHIHLNTSVRADLQWWHCFLQLWNGLSFSPCQAHQDTSILMHRALLAVGHSTPLQVGSSCSGLSYGPRSILQPRRWSQLQ